MRTKVQVLGDPGDLGAPPGSHPWAVAMRLELLNTYQQRDDYANHLQRMRDWFLVNEGWRVLKDSRGRPFDSWEAFCEARSPYGLGTKADHLDAEVERRKLQDRDGRPRKDETVRGERLSHGENAAYLLARLDKGQHDELAAQVRAGTLKAKTAARQAGIIKPKSILQQLETLWTKASDAERRAFLDSKRNAVGNTMGNDRRNKVG